MRVRTQTGSGGRACRRGLGPFTAETRRARRKRGEEQEKNQEKDQEKDQEKTRRKLRHGNVAAGAGVGVRGWGSGGLRLRLAGWCGLCGRGGHERALGLGLVAGGLAKRLASRREARSMDWRARAMRSTAMRSRHPLRRDFGRRCPVDFYGCGVGERRGTTSTYRGRSSLPRIHPMTPPAGTVSHPVKMMLPAAKTKHAATASRGLSIRSPSDDRAPDA